MLGDVKTLNHRLLARRCVSCGYDGALLRGGQAARCPRCACDLQLRPPRSYAEMEGLVGHPIAVHPSVASGSGANAAPRESLLTRWLVFLFIWMSLIVAIVCLSAVAIPA